jgi:hypothetical protein
MGEGTGGSARRVRPDHGGSGASGSSSLRDFGPHENPASELKIASQSSRSLKRSFKVVRTISQQVRQIVFVRKRRRIADFSKTNAEDPCRALENCCSISAIPSRRRPAFFLTFRLRSAQGCHEDEPGCEHDQAVGRCWHGREAAAKQKGGNGNCQCAVLQPAFQ